jgi:hypothetical protein
VAVTITAFAIAGSVLCSPAKATTAIDLVEPGTTFFGKSYNRLAGQWWNWALKEPTETSPLTDTTGEDCARNQNGAVWFLAGTFIDPPIAVTRDCTVPAGKAIFFSFGNTVSVHPENTSLDVGNRCTRSGRYNLDTLAGRLGGVRCDANDDMIGNEIGGDDVVYKFVNPKVSIDDLRTLASPDYTVRDPYGYRAQSQPGGYTQQIPPGSVLTDFGIDPGPRFPAVADGYWFFLKPLPAGRYVLRFESTDRLSGVKIIDVTYNLRIK